VRNSGFRPAELGVTTERANLVFCDIQYKIQYFWKLKIMKKIRIVLIGAGETGTPLLRQLLGVDFVEVVGVADLNDDQPGITLAKVQGVPTTNDFMTLLSLGEAIDIVIDVTGVAQVRDQLRSHMQTSGNHHTIIMHELIAVLLMSLSQGKLVSMKHNAVDYV
jgi:predicted homoserine dehydrogenase-like protein